MNDRASNEDQRRFWSDEAGASWVRQMRAMDATLAGVLDHVLLRADLSPGDRVLDIGCGAGTSTRRAAERVGPDGEVTGFDISVPLLAHAQSYGDRIRYINSDAQQHDFETESSDVILSRFGVMFFADPQVAFANLARALKPGGRMSFATWGEIAENPFFTLPARVARTTLGPVPKSDPDAPGPFALRDADRVQKILAGAGLSVQVDTLSELLPLGEDPAAIAATMHEIGPIAGALRHHDANQSQRAAVTDALITALENHRGADGYALPSQIHYFTAIKPT